MRRRRADRTSLVSLAGAAALLLAVAGCSSDDAEPPEGAPTSPSAPPSAAPPPTPPQDRACYRLDVDAAVAPTSDARPVDCSRAHTSLTFAVGELDNVVDGHLLAVDSRRVQAEVAATCPRRLAEFVGGSVTDQRLSMLRAVWFTPTVEESDAGAAWYRCDVIAVAGDDRLAPLDRELEGVLATPAGRDRYAMCGTAAPDAPDFERVICSRPHSWRAIATVDLRPGDYPGADVVRDRGQAVCEDAGREVADDALDYEWGYEWPSAAQWRTGQTFGRCWAPV